MNGGEMICHFTCRGYVSRTEESHSRVLCDWFIILIMKVVFSFTQSGCPSDDKLTFTEQCVFLDTTKNKNCMNSSNGSFNISSIPHVPVFFWRGNLSEREDNSIITLVEYWLLCWDPSVSSNNDNGTYLLGMRHNSLCRSWKRQLYF